MHSWSRFLWMASLVFEFAFATPLAFITIPLLGFVGAMFYRNRSNLRGPLKRSWIGCLLQLLLLITSIGIATRGEVDGTRQPFLGPNDLGLRIENYVVVAAFVFAAIAIVCAKGSRWFTTSLMLLQIWLLASAYAVAGMALTGRWV
jgi:hypothetical protein